MNGTRAKLLAAVLLGALAGCAQEPVPRDAFYRLHGPDSPPTARQTLPGVLEVEEITADGLTAQRAMVHRNADGALARYSYHHWAEPPPRMLRTVLTRALRQAGAADRVTTPDYRIRADHRLRGRLLGLHVLPDERPPSVVVELELGVVEQREMRLRLLETYRVTETADSASPAAYAAAFDRAISEVVRRFLDDLDAAGA